jgi:hypothetical protein
VWFARPVLGLVRPFSRPSLGGYRACVRGTPVAAIHDDSAARLEFPAHARASTDRTTRTERPIMSSLINECQTNTDIERSAGLHCEGAQNDVPRAVLFVQTGEALRHAAHAAARWAKAIVPILDSPSDLRTVADWSRWVGASQGALRDWCRTARITPRRSLVFGRLLRAVLLSDGGRHAPENLLDVVDRRTLAGLLKLAGLSAGTFPHDVREFLESQVLIRDEDTLVELERALQGHLERKLRHASPSVR